MEWLVLAKLITWCNGEMGRSNAVAPSHSRRASKRNNCCATGAIQKDMPVGSVRSFSVALRSVDSQAVTKKGPPILIDGLSEIVFPVQEAPWSKLAHHCLQITIELRRLQAIDIHFVTTILRFLEIAGARCLSINKPQIAQIHPPRTELQWYVANSTILKPL